MQYNDKKPNNIYIKPIVVGLPIFGLHALPNSPRILTADLQAHISRRSVYLDIV